MSDFPYEDIVNLPHHVSTTRPPMPLADRAAQFAPFAALTGHGDAIAETARATSRRCELSACQLLSLSRRLAYATSFADHPLLSITYYRPDSRKEGGAYVTVTCRIRRVEQCLNLLTLDDGSEIPLDAVTDISGDIFDDFEDY